MIVSDNTQNMNNTESETFFPYQIFTESDTFFKTNFLATKSDLFYLDDDHPNHANHDDHLDHHTDLDNIEQVPLCKVNLSEGEQQWRLLHRMTGPRDQVMTIITINLAQISRKKG